MVIVTIERKAAEKQMKFKCYSILFPTKEVYEINEQETITREKVQFIYSITKGEDKYLK